MANESNLTLITQAEAFFQELITQALGRHRASIRPETEVYLVQLLNQFMNTERLYTRNANGELREEPLALLVKEALEQPHRQAQSAMFRHIGDFSLYTAGFFQESLNRKLVDVDYYIDMGGTAYQQVAARSEEEIMRAVYLELANKFGSFVEVLAEVSEKTTPRTEKDLLRLYEVWVRTRSDRAAKALQEAGILPNQTIKKDWQ